MLLIVLLIFFVAFFAMNMGGSTFAASFAAAYGGGVLNKRKSQWLFLFFVIVGALAIGRPVANTLGNELIPHAALTPDTVLIILISATLSLFISNLLRVPQSTSFVTVFSIIGVGFYFRLIYTEKVYYLIPFWLLIPPLGYFLTYAIGKLIYPPRKKNLWLYEKVINHQRRLKFFVIVASCYNAFSVGANNVANAVGPLLGAELTSNILGFILIAPVFGMGSFVFHKPLEEMGEKIVPLGLFTSTLIAIVSGTLMLIVSILGIPQSFVMLNVACIFGISAFKDGPGVTFSNPVTKRTYLSWAVMPVISFFLAYFLTYLRFKLF